MASKHRNGALRRATARESRWFAAAACVLACGAKPVAAGDAPAQDAPRSPASLEETRLVMGKWIETQQIVSKERNEWQQAREILGSRIDLAKREVAGLEERIRQAETSVGEAQAKRAELAKKEQQLDATNAKLASSLAKLESEVRRLIASLPEPVQTKLQPLARRIPEDPNDTRASTPERFQNVLGILDELNKANNEIAVTYEVRTLADGKPAEVRVMYLGLAQAYYVSSGGEAGIGRPGPNGWTWEPSKAVANDVTTALEIIQGKHTPAFVPLPVKLR